MDYLAEHCKPGQPVRFKELREAVGVKDRPTFLRKIRRHPEFRLRLRQMGIVKWGAGQR